MSFLCSRGWSSTLSSTTWMTVDLVARVGNRWEGSLSETRGGGGRRERGRFVSEMQAK